MFEEDDSELDPSPTAYVDPDAPIPSDSPETALGAISQVLSGPSKREKAILGEMKSSAEQARQALIDARKRIMAQRINPADPWLAASAAFLSPTKTGRFGENLGNVAGALRDYTQRSTELESGKNDALTKLALAEAGLNNPALSAELSFEKIRQQMAARLLAGSNGRTPASVAEWNLLTKDMTPDQIAHAARVKLGINPRSGTFTIKTVNGVPTATGIDAETNEPIAIPLTTLAAQTHGAQAVKTGEKTGTDLGEEYSKIQAGAPAAQARLNQVDQLEELLGGLDSGSLAQVGVRAAELAKSFGINIDPKLGAKQAALAIGNGLALQLRNPSAGAGMPGSLSNSDRDFLVSMLPSLMQTADGRRKLIDYMRRMAQRDMDVAKLARGYKQEHGQYDEYFYDDLAKWSEEHPIFTSGLKRPKEVPPEEWYKLTGKQQTTYLQMTQPKKARGGRVAYQTGGKVVTLPDGTQVHTTDGDSDQEPPAETKSNKADTSELKSIYDILLGAGAGAGVGLGVDALLPRGKSLRPAEQRVVSTMDREQVDPQQALQRLESLQRSGTPATLMTEPSMRGLSETALSSASPAEARASLDELERQHEGARGRIERQVQQGLKPQGSYFQTQKNLTNALYSNAKPLYEALYKKYPGVVISPEIGEIFKTDTGKAAIKEAIRLMDIEGNTIGKANALGAVMKPNLQFLDYVKRGMDAMIEKAEPNGVPSTEGRALRNLRTRFRDAVDAAAPGDYKAARQQYAGDLEVRNALEEGRQFHEFQPEELEARANGMSKAEKSAFRTGMAQRLMEYIGSPSSDADTARRIIGSPKMLASLKPFFDTPQEFDVFNRALAQEVELFHGTRDLMNAGERGQVQRQRGDQENKLRTRAQAVTESLGVSRPLHFATKSLNAIPDMTQDQANEVLRILQSNDPAAMSAFSRRIAAAKIKKPMTGRRALAAGAAALAGAGVGALIGNEQE